MEIDDNTESIGKKVRQAQIEQWNYILVIGDKEIESGSFNIRNENKQISDLSLNVFIQKLKEEEKNRSLTSCFNWLCFELLFFSISKFMLKN